MIQEPNTKSTFAVSSSGTTASTADTDKGVTHASYRVDGSATKAVNGTYLRFSNSCGAPCFKNENNVLLFLATLGETPELSITAKDVDAKLLYSETRHVPRIVRPVETSNFYDLARLGRSLVRCDDSTQAAKISANMKLFFFRATTQVVNSKLIGIKRRKSEQSDIDAPSAAIYQRTI